MGILQREVGVFPSTLAPFERRRRRPQVLLPQWQINPDVRDILLPNGDLPFEEVTFPSNFRNKEGVLPLSSLHFVPTHQTYQLPENLALQKDSIIAQRTQQLEQKERLLVTQWEKEGRNGEKPHIEFFNGSLTRVVPGDICISPQGIITVGYGDTSYFDFVVSRNTSLPPQHSAMPLTTTVLLKVSDKVGNPYMLYTKRTHHAEASANFFHVVSGFVDKNGDNINPVNTVLQELHEEVGIQPHEAQVDGLLGIFLSKNTLSAFAYSACLKKPIEDLFLQEGEKLIPKERTTDGEVEIRLLSWTPDCVRANLLGQPTQDRQTLYPWVGIGAASIMAAGREDFGQEWYEQTKHDYHQRMRGYVQNQLNLI